MSYHTLLTTDVEDMSQQLQLPWKQKHHMQSFAAEDIIDTFVHREQI